MVLVTKIKEYREKAGMKQAELAELVNARRETIVHLENGKYNPSLKLAMDIASFLKLLLRTYLSLQTRQMYLKREKILRAVKLI